MLLELKPLDAFHDVIWLCNALVNEDKQGPQSGFHQIQLTQGKQNTGFRFYIPSAYMNIMTLYFGNILSI